MATPDGRNAHEPLARMLLTPAHNTDKNGPTAVFKIVLSFVLKRSQEAYFLTRR